MYKINLVIVRGFPEWLYLLVFGDRSSANLYGFSQKLSTFFRFK